MLYFVTMSFARAIEPASALSTVKPSRARRIAGSMTRDSGIVPNFASASAMPATEPGTPDARWPYTLLLVSFPFASRYMSRVAASGATSR